MLSRLSKVISPDDRLDYDTMERYENENLDPDDSGLALIFNRHF
jgi:hypothetical protein